MTSSTNRCYSYVMRPLRYSINVTLDGCCDHCAMFADEDLHRHAVENLDQADALLFGRVTYEMMEAAWRPPTRTGARPDWMEPFARTIDAAKKYVVSSTLDRVDWTAEHVRGDLGKAVQQLKRESDSGQAFAQRETSTGIPETRCDSPLPHIARPARGLAMLTITSPGRRHERPRRTRDTSPVADGTTAHDASASSTRRAGSNTKPS